ncbi:MAG: hypothetical protein HYW63_05130 [Candidatus Levybacteria bacterium]|nr:hypothetical protein [Candidatus Levybacteria bacterium]
MTKKGFQTEFKNVLLVIEREDVKKAVKGLRIKWKIPDNGFTDIDDYNKWINDLTEQLLSNSENGSPSRYSLFLDDINTLCRNLKIPSYWKVFLRTYIPTGKVKEKLVLRVKSLNAPSINIVLKGKEEKIRLEFGANTKLADIKTIWGKVKEHQKILPDYDTSRKRRRLVRDIEIFKKSQAGKKPKEIYEDLPPETPDDDLSLQALNKASQRMKKIIKGQ